MSIGENVYGSAKRLAWIRTNVHAGDSVLEFGCGTGCMITLPLALDGVDVTGVDLDERSIEVGRSMLARHGLNPDRLSTRLLVREQGPKYDVIVASEVLEHIQTQDLDETLLTLSSRLKPGGRLLVTVPNGYGWFEIEHALWELGFGRLVSAVKLDAAFSRLRRLVSGSSGDDECPNTLADDVSPHVQRFTRNSIRVLLERNGFEVDTPLGSVLFCGPFTETVFRGVTPFLRINGWLGGMLPNIASGFYVSAQVRRPGHQR